MSYLQLRFSQNKCRMCTKTFCCKRCRLKHENNIHKKFPDCGICISGVLLFSSTTPDLLEHIKKHHWPIHCVLCKRFFGSPLKLMEPTQCRTGSTKIDQSKTPMRPVPDVVTKLKDSEEYFSPPIVGTTPGGLCKHLTTSTPLQGGEKVLQLEGFPNTITPVDNHDKKTKINDANENLSAHTPHNNEEQKKSDNGSKRRVTFGEVPHNESLKKVPESDGSLKGSLKSCKPQQLSLATDITSPPQIESLDNTDNNYVSACNNTIMCENKENEVLQLEKIKKRRSSGMSDTMWQSAINETLDLGNDTAMDDEDSVVQEPLTDINTQEDSLKNIHGSEEHFTFVDNSSDRVRNMSPEDSRDLDKPAGIWSSVADMMKNVVQGFSTKTIPMRNRFKRQLSDSEIADLELVRFKRIKLTEIKCRRPIRGVFYRRRSVKKTIKKVDKSTQTDD